MQEQYQKISQEIRKLLLEDYIRIRTDGNLIYLINVIIDNFYEDGPFFICAKNEKHALELAREEISQDELTLGFMDECEANVFDDVEDDDYIYDYDVLWSDREFECIGCLKSAEDINKIPNESFNDIAYNTTGKLDVFIKYYITEVIEAAEKAIPQDSPAQLYLEI